MRRIAQFHPDVDYSKLPEYERDRKISRDLFTVFYLHQNKGLTDIEILKTFAKLGINGYDNLTPEATVRGNMYKWNNMVVGKQTGKKLCKKCSRLATHGSQNGENIEYCSHHATNDMILLVKIRVISKKLPRQRALYYLHQEFCEMINLPSQKIDDASLSKNMINTNVQTSYRRKKARIERTPLSPPSLPKPPTIQTTTSQKYLLSLPLPIPFGWRICKERDPFMGWSVSEVDHSGFL